MHTLVGSGNEENPRHFGDQDQLHVPTGSVERVLTRCVCFYYSCTSLQLQPAVHLLLPTLATPLTNGAHAGTAQTDRCMRLQNMYRAGILSPERSSSFCTLAGYRADCSVATLATTFLRLRSNGLPVLYWEHTCIPHTPALPFHRLASLHTSPTTLSQGAASNACPTTAVGI